MVDQVQSAVTAVESKTTEVRMDVDQMDDSLSFLNKEITNLKLSLTATKTKPNANLVSVSRNYF